MTGSGGFRKRANAGTHKRIAQLAVQEIQFRQGWAILERMVQGGIHSGLTGQHGRIAAVALPFTARDSVRLAGVGDDDRGPKTGAKVRAATQATLVAEIPYLRKALAASSKSRFLFMEFGELSGGRQYLKRHCIISVTD